MTRNCFVHVWLLLTAACAGSGDGPAGGRASVPLEPKVRDSASITIYEHPADAIIRAPLLTLDSTPLAVFAGDVDNPENDVSALSWPIFLRSGDLIGYDRQTGSLLTLKTTTGERVHRGRSGNGPGEIGFPGMFQLLEGDSILFTDSENDRIAIATSESGIVRTITQTSVVDLRRASVLGRIGGGTGAYLLAVPGPQIDPQGMAPLGQDVEVGHFGVWNAVADSVQPRFSVPIRRVIRVPFPGGSWIHQLALTTVTSIGTWGEGFLVARGQQWLLERWDTGGRVDAIIRINLPARAADDSAFEQWVQGDADRWMQNLAHRGVSPNHDSIVEAARDRPHADTVAAYGEAYVSPNGTLWVTDYQLRPRSEWSATAVSPDGRILGRLEGILGEPPIAWGDDRVATTTEDDDGISTIRILKVRGLSP